LRWVKTVVAGLVRENDLVPMTIGDEPSQEMKDLAASFQAAVVHALIGTLEKLAIELQPKTLVVAGGVACNLALRSAAVDAGKRLGLPIYFPSKHLSTDNAAMIAAAGYRQLVQGDNAKLDMTADVTMRLQNVDNEEAELRRKHVKYRL